MEVYRRAAESASEDTRVATRRWASRELGAPKEFDALIVGIEERDEILTRLATTVQHRALEEQRFPGPKGRRGKQRMRPEDIDPWLVTLEELKHHTEYLDCCRACAGAGSVGCPPCAQTGRLQCGNCGGSGRVWKQQQRGGRHIQCGVCRAAGTVACGACGGDGSVTCAGCAGSANQQVWAAYRQQSRTFVEMHPESPVIDAHRYLRDLRSVGAEELRPFLQLVSVKRNGALKPDSLDDEGRVFVDEHGPSLDSRLDRISEQQLVKLSVPRRDVTYELCGTRGVLVLSGTNLLGTSTVAALRPIRTRRLVWGIGTGVLVVTLWVVIASASGSTAYFQTSNMGKVLCGFLASVLIFLSLGALTRALRPQLRFRRFYLTERVTFGALGAALAAMMAIHWLSRPSVAEARSAIARGDLARADVVVEALGTVRLDATQLGSVRDELLLAHAATLDGDVKLKTLDDVASHGSPSSTKAASEARSARLGMFDSDLAAGKLKEARSVLDTWPKRSDDDPAQVPELRARAFDFELAHCADNLCKWTASRSSDAAAPTPERQTREHASRDALLEDLTFIDKAGEAPAARLERIRKMGGLAKAIGNVTGDDELAGKVKSALEWSQSERAKVPLLGAEGAVVAELLGGTVSAKETHATVGSVAVYWALDGTQHCTGVYLTGKDKGARGLDDSAHSDAMKALLAQALGHPGPLPSPPASGIRPTNSSTHDGNVNITARWHNGHIVELRIGDATP